MKKRMIAEMSISAQEVLRRLEKCGVGEMIRYDELSLLAMGNIQKEKRHALTTALNRVLIDQNMVFGAVRNIGIQRMDDSAIVNTSSAGTIKIARSAKRHIKKLSVVEYSGLKPDEKIQHNTMMTVYKITAHINSDAVNREISAKIKSSEGPLPVGDIYKMFGGR